MRAASVAFAARVAKTRNMQHDHHHHDHARDGAKQPNRFDPARAARLDDPARFAYLPSARVFELLAVPPGASVCDFGTGTGTYAIELARSRLDVRVLALDEQPEMLDMLRAKPAAQALANLHPMLPDQLANERGQIQRVLAVNVLHELGDDALAELAALLAPDGFALMIDWNAATDRPTGPPAEHVYTPDAATERLRAAGFAVRAHASFPYHYALTVTR